MGAAERAEFDPELLIEPEWLDWYRLTPTERLRATERLWENYLELGGGFDPDPDPDSPFWSRKEIEGFAKSAAEGKRKAFGQKAC